MANQDTKSTINDIENIDSDIIIHICPWKNHVYGERLELVWHTRWMGLGSSAGPSDVCLVCNSRDECHEAKFEWGDTGSYEYFSELCHNCFEQLVNNCKNVTNKKFLEIFGYQLERPKWHPEYVPKKENNKKRNKENNNKEQNPKRQKTEQKTEQEIK